MKWFFLSLLLFQPAIAPLWAQAGSPPAPKPGSPPPAPNGEYVEVVATRIPEAPDEVPAALEVLGGDELRSRGARDLASALLLAAGIDVAPGGDGGPASSVPEFWGLREFDAFLLVVDGVPWGGAFNPALSALSLEDVERVEILRGPAPVTYGSTSFVGVIEVVRKDAAASRQSFRVHGGSYGSGGAAAVFRLPTREGWDSRLVVDGERRGFRDERTSFRRAHALWSNSVRWGDGRFWFNLDAVNVDQDPASPHPREGRTLSTRVPVDANHNPRGAFLNDMRTTFLIGFDRPVGDATWTTSVSVSRADQGLFRGFLGEPEGAVVEARGIRENIDLTDVYADSHWAWKAAPGVTLVAGADFLAGRGRAEGADFDYDVPLDGSREVSVAVPELDREIRDRRDFFGAYLLSEWTPMDRLKLTGGIRLSATRERRESGEGDRPTEFERSRQTNVRPGGSAGVLFTAWQKGANRVRLYANYRDTFKPAAFDFGLGESEEGEGLLKPETSRSYEGGMKALLWQARVRLDASLFLSDFRNLVVARSVNGVPGLTNAGSQRFKGFEAAAFLNLPYPWSGRVSYSFHDARFRDYVAEFDGVPTQLAGNRLEMSARHLFSAGILRAPERGVVASLEVKAVGSRYLNKRNSALAAGFATLSASTGYRFQHWELRVDGRNLTDRRVPVSESELGDAQYYLLPSRVVDAELIWRF